MASNMIRLIGILLGIVVLVGIVMTGSYVFDAYLISSEKDAQAQLVTIEEGASVAAIARQLQDQGIITSAFFFKVYVKLSDAVLQAGTFELEPGMSLRAVVARLTDAKAQEVEVTIPEGFTHKQIFERVHEALPEISMEMWEEAVGMQGVGRLPINDATIGIPQGKGLEGYLFPDTYRFRIDADAETIASTMYVTLLRRLYENGFPPPTTLEALRYPNGLTLHETLTLASIVEREVRAPEDMKLVAGIFFTRLKIGMALQADSTVNYLTGKSEASVSLEDSRIDSPYNTYQHLGLPPGPINNPGLNAIRAVFEPTDSDFLYFLTTDDGQVVYAKTFDEHIANKYKYLK